MPIKSIQILGAGCPTCKNLYETVKKIASDLKIEAAVEYVNDINKMIELGLMTSPALVINGRSVLLGGGHSEEKIKKILEDAMGSAEANGGCPCGCADC